jgi:hypothetical protein
MSEMGLLTAGRNGASAASAVELAKPVVLIKPPPALSVLGFFRSGGVSSRRSLASNPRLTGSASGRATPGPGRTGEPRCDDE